MDRLSSHSAEPLVQAPLHKQTRPDAADRQIVILAVFLTTVALAYFYIADSLFVSGKMMSPIFQLLLMVDDFNTAWLMLGICLLAAFWKNPAPAFKIADWLGRHGTAVSVATVAPLALGALFVYHNNAFCMDEYAAVFQAKIFAAGHLTAQLPPSVVNWLIPPGFNGAFLVASRTTGQAIEGYWPGYALLLAPFEFLGIPWLCNACLAGLSLFLIHRITLEITSDRRAAGWAIFFTVASGAFVGNAISYYSMQAHLTANLLFVWLLLKPSPYRAFGAGVVGSFALVLHNPFPHTMFAIPWIIAIARTKMQQRYFFPLILGYLPLSIVLGAGWLHFRGSIIPADSEMNLIGGNLSTVFSLPDRSMIEVRLASLVKMWVWAVPGVFLLAVLGRLRRGENQYVRLLAQSAVLTFVGYVFFVFDQGHGWGYRYFHSAWGVVPILAACAMTGRPASNGQLAAFAGASAALSLLLIVPFQMNQIETVIARHLAQLPSPRRPGNNVYFIRATGFYSADLVQMDPFLRTDDLILFSAGSDKDEQLRRQNWPGATLVARGFSAEEWHLGPQDQRKVSEHSLDIKRFEFTYIADRGIAGNSDGQTGAH